MKVNYSSDNSGGYWWLKEPHWLALEADGWVVEWGCLVYHDDNYEGLFGTNKYKNPTKKTKCHNKDDRGECQGHRRYASLAAAKKDKFDYLGCYAKAASKEVEDPIQAIRDFERVTGLDASDEGCNCCGAPHCFSWKDEAGKYHCLSGEDIAVELTQSNRFSYREALEEIKRLKAGNTDR